jgi:hypothetical protein
MTDKKDDDQGKKIKKVVSIANGQPLNEGPQVDPHIVNLVEETLRQVYAGNVDQIVIIMVSDNGPILRVVEGETITPEIMYTQLELMTEDYKIEYVRKMDAYVEYLE